MDQSPSIVSSVADNAGVSLLGLLVAQIYKVSKILYNRESSLFIVFFVVIS